MVPVFWYIGHAPTAEEWDTVPPVGANVLTPREYQARWLDVYGQLVGRQFVAGQRSAGVGADDDLRRLPDPPAGAGPGRRARPDRARRGPGVRADPATAGPPRRPAADNHRGARPGRRGRVPVRAVAARPSCAGPHADAASPSPSDLHSADAEPPARSEPTGSVGIGGRRARVPIDATARRRAGRGRRRAARRAAAAAPDRRRARLRPASADPRDASPDVRLVRALARPVPRRHGRPRRTAVARRRRARPRPPVRRRPLVVRRPAGRRRAVVGPLPPLRPVRVRSRRHPAVDGRLHRPAHRVRAGPPGHAAGRRRLDRPLVGPPVRRQRDARAAPPHAGDGPPRGARGPARAVHPLARAEQHRLDDGAVARRRRPDPRGRRPSST